MDLKKLKKRQKNILNYNNLKGESLMDIKNDYIAKAMIYVEEEGNKVKRLDALKKTQRS